MTAEPGVRQGDRGGEREAEWSEHPSPLAHEGSMAIVFIGMEAVGDAVTNKNEIWVDPVDFQQELREAVFFLNGWGIDVGISNIPLCLLPTDLHKFSWHSISDWKVSYLPFCHDCDLRFSCGGVFATAQWQSQNLHPVKFEKGVS